jgi:hypothetical protein
MSLHFYGVNLSVFVSRALNKAAAGGGILLLAKNGGRQRGWKLPCLAWRHDGMGSPPRLWVACTLQVSTHRRHALTCPGLHALAPKPVRF